MQLNNHDLGNDRIPSLFRAYLLPTLVGMLSICGVTAIDGIFIGHGVGSASLNCSLVSCFVIDIM